MAETTPPKKRVRRKPKPPTKTRKQLLEEARLDQLIPNIKSRAELEAELLPPNKTANVMAPLEERQMVPASEFFTKEKLRLDFTPEEAALIRHLEAGQIGLPDIVRKASLEHLERVSLLIALKGTHVLHDMMIDESLEPEIRKQIAQDMINRQLGLPTQKVKIEDDKRIEVFSRTNIDEVRQNQKDYEELIHRTKDHVAVFNKRKDALEIEDHSNDIIDIEDEGSS